MESLFSFLPLVFLALLVLGAFLSFVTVPEGVVAVITIFQKYRRILRPGLNFKIPFFENVFRFISIQNRSVELQFQAITLDQANVNFKAMLLYAVVNHDEETIKNVAFKFMDDRSFMQSLVRTIEGSIRGFVATKRQAEVLSLRVEIVSEVKSQIDSTLAGWGYHLIDLQINDITFDNVIMESMAKVVASNNLKAAAENEGQALLITKTKAAEAEGNAIKISAEAEMLAAQLRGQGVALFRKEVARGMASAAAEMKNAELDSSVLLFAMWTESVKHFAENGKGNMLFLDGSPTGMQRTLHEIMGLNAGLSQKQN